MRILLLANIIVYFLGSLAFLVDGVLIAFGICLPSKYGCALSLFFSSCFFLAVAKSWFDKLKERGER